MPLVGNASQRAHGAVSNDGDRNIIDAVDYIMACLLRFGSLPPATDPTHPTPAELEAVQARLAEYQAVFDTH